MSDVTYVTKRDGRKEPVMFDKIAERISLLANKDRVPLNVNVFTVTQKVIQGIYDGIKTSELDNLAAETAIWMYSIHPDYATLASRILISNLHKETISDYFELCEELIKDKENPLIIPEILEIVRKYRTEITVAMDYKKDYRFTFFGFKVLERSYLIRKNKKVIERPQHLYMRVAIGIHKWDIQGILDTYKSLSEGKYIHATPTLFNAGRPFHQLASCFLMSVGDSVKTIYKTLGDCAEISKHSGGIGFHIHDVRAKGSYIKGTDGYSNGIVPMLKTFESTAKFINQGGKRPGSFACYLEPWHADIEDFLELKKNTGKEEMRARDIFYSLWIPDLFMKRVESNSKWSLFCPNKAPGLSDVWGEEFENLYEKYEIEGRANKVIKAQDLWNAIVTSQIETGGPYMLYKDACNKKSNQNNLGTIKCSNLCTEIIQYTSAEETAVCNLASISLPSCFNEETKIYNHDELYKIAYEVTRNLNKVIDVTYYPTPETKNSNLKHRPIGIGIQGLAETFFKLRYPFTSPEAKQLNKEIFETIYFAALNASCDMAREFGPYSSYKGSLVSKNILSFDVWGIKPTSGRWNWDKLRNKIKVHGIRNSLLLAPMPTASTSSILGNTECFEPITSNCYTRRVSAGDFPLINPYLVDDLIKLQLWNDDMKNTIIVHKGSVQSIPSIPKELKELYKTVWEISMKDIIDMAKDRGAYIDQSQSMNLFLAFPTKNSVTSMHFYAWKSGLKTGMYYLRTKPAVDAIQFTVNTPQVPLPPKKEAMVCEMEKGCLMCGS
jgi:ribonucleoside-diphosphate reductase alpha subunit